MPDCNDVVRELFAYLDGEVTLNVRTEIADLVRMEQVKDLIDHLEAKLSR